MKKIPLEGKRFGMLIVIEDSGVRKNNVIVYKCKCDCGNDALVRRNQLINGHSRSCGCIQKKRSSELGKLLAEENRCGRIENTNLSMIANTKPNRDNRSGVKGVYFDERKKLWFAYLTYQGERKLRSAFQKFEDAVAARKAAEDTYYKPMLEKHNWKAGHDLKEKEEQQ